MIECVGIVPCGGKATRLGHLPCSKELLPINFNTKNAKIISVVSEYLLHYYTVANIQQIFMIISPGKWDIPAYYGTGSKFSAKLGYLIVDIPFGVPFTINQAYPFVKNSLVALGFPDIIMEPNHVFKKLIDLAKNTEADIILGLFPVTKPNKWDMIEFDTKQNIKSIVIKENRTDLSYGWSVAVWKPAFTEFLNHYLTQILKENTEGKIQTSNGLRELYIGDVIQAAKMNGLKLSYEIFEQGHCIDIGTPEDLQHIIDKNLQPK